MTFSQFLIYVVAAYLIYYLILITYDLLISNTKGAKEPSESLVYKEDENIQVIEDNTNIIIENENIEETKKHVVEPVAGSPNLNVSGGVKMQDLIGLYKQNALALTTQVFNK